MANRKLACSDNWGKLPICSTETIWDFTQTVWDDITIWDPSERVEWTLPDYEEEAS